MSDEPNSSTIVQFTPPSQEEQTTSIIGIESIETFQQYKRSSNFISGYEQIATGEIVNKDIYIHDGTCFKSKKYNGMCYKFVMSFDTKNRKFFYFSSEKNASVLLNCLNDAKDKNPGKDISLAVRILCDNSNGKKFYNLASHSSLSDSNNQPSSTDTNNTTDATTEQSTGESKSDNQPQQQEFVRRIKKEGDTTQTTT